MWTLPLFKILNIYSMWTITSSKMLLNKVLKQLLVVQRHHPEADSKIQTCSWYQVFHGFILTNIHRNTKRIYLKNWKETLSHSIYTQKTLIKNLNWKSRIATNPCVCANSEILQSSRLMVESSTENNNVIEENGYLLIIPTCLR